MKATGPARCAILVARFALAALLVPSAMAQRYLVTEDDTKTVRIADLGAGALLGPVVIDVGATATPAPGELWDAAVVDDEIWVAASTHVHRYDRSSLAWLGAIGPFSSPAQARGIEVAGGFAWVAAVRELWKLTFDGGVVAQIDVPSAHDVLYRAGELLVSNQFDDSLDRYDLSGSMTGVFADLRGTLAVGPGQMIRRSNGNVVVAGIGRLAEIDAAGNVVDEMQAGIFEQGVAETSGGRFFTPNAVAPARLYDRASRRYFPVGGGRLRYCSPLDRPPTSRRYCPASDNSTGAPASMAAMGSASVDENDFRFLLSAMPAMRVAQLLWGDAPKNMPFGDGTLCVDPSAAGFVRGTVVRTDVTGVALDQIDLESAPGSRITPGSTWFFQFVFRDSTGGGSGFNLSDAIQVSFLP